jgi:hypothetical protein
MEGSGSKRTRRSSLKAFESSPVEDGENRLSGDESSPSTKENSSPQLSQRKSMISASGFQLNKSNRHDTRNPKGKRARVGAGVGAHDEDEVHGHVVEDDYDDDEFEALLSSRRPSRQTKGRKRNSGQAKNEGRGSLEVGVDADGELDADDDDDVAGPKTESGHIVRIYVENFMCHRKMTVEFGRHVNFVTGENGSGGS